MLNASFNFERTARDTASNFRFTSDFTIANSSQTFLWERNRSENSHSVLRLYRTSFRYAIENQFEESRLFTNSNIQDWGDHWKLTQKLTDSFSQTFGADAVQHQVSPNVISTSGRIAQLLETSNTVAQKSLESSVFYQADGKFHHHWSWSAGMRISSAQINQTSYLNPEPRIAIHYRLNENAALKASYSRMAQYIHRISSAAVAFPTDIWYPVTDRVVPQTADQLTLAFQQHIPRQSLFVSVETYYKSLQNLIGYREGTNLFLNTSFEDQLIQGVGQAYGVEVLIKKEKGKLTGWISYTLSTSLRQYDEINQGNWFLSRYDRRHNVALVLNYELSKHFSLSGVFEFMSGSRFTPVIGQYIVPSTTLGGVQLIPVYAPINSVKLANAHRLDLGLKYRSSATKKFRSEWFIGVYNTYNRATPIGINIVPNEDGSFRYEQPGLFGLLPFVSYGFKF
ncbi:MAG: TonB-dependent receptor plug domain-containing protein [Flammeovirgaceae bacterium]